MALRCLFMILSLLLIVEPSYAGKGRNNRRSGELVASPTSNQAPANYVDAYIKDSLRVLDRDEIIVAKKLWDELMTAAGASTDVPPGMTWRDVPLPEAAIEYAKRTYFSEFSAPYLGEFIRAMMASSVANPLVLGPAGVGKSYLISQITLILHFNIYPDYMRRELGINSDDPNEPFAAIRNAVLGKTEVVLVTNEMLRTGKTEKGQAHMDVDDRRAAAVEGLTDAARREFRRTDKEGRRTLFMLEEIATLDADVQQTMKKILERTGVRNPNDPVERRKDVGFHIGGITTDDEKQKLMQGEGAIERRYRLIRMIEMSEAAGLALLKGKVKNEYFRLYRLTATDEALNYIIHMRRFFDNPPQAMPGNIIKALEDFYTWSINLDNRPAAGVNVLSLKDAQNFINKRLSLTDLWNEGENAEPPLSGLAACVKEILVGQDEIVDQVASKIAAWARLGFSGPLPAFFLGGPSGSGKDTLFIAFNLCLFGHEGGAFMADIANQEGFGLPALVKGPPVGNHADDQLPWIAKVLDQGLSSMIAFNEAQDIGSGHMEILKLLLQTGEVHPEGKDQRTRSIYFPLFFMGQWGEYLFNEKDENGNYTTTPIRDEARITEIYANLNQQDINAAFASGKRIFGQTFISETDERYGTYGAVPYPALQRSIMAGGQYILRPVSRLNFPRIIEIKLRQLVRSALMSNNMQLSVTPALIEFIADVAEHNIEGTRGLHSTTMDFTRRAISEAMNDGLPVRGAIVEVDYARSTDGEHQILVRYQTSSNPGVWHTTPPQSARALRSAKMTCKDTLVPDSQAQAGLRSNNDAIEPAR